jgi:hypothetical protein
MSMSRVAYQIRVVGAVPARLLEDFARVTVSLDHVGTTLRADLTDQAELHGLLDALRRDGLVLMEVRREQVLDADSEAADDDASESTPPPP